MSRLSIFGNHAQATQGRLATLRLRRSVKRVAALVIAERDGGRLVQPRVTEDGGNVAGCRAEPPGEREARTLARGSERVATDDSLANVASRTARVGRECTESRRSLRRCIVVLLGGSRILVLLILVLKDCSVLSHRSGDPKVIDVEGVFLVG